jgi:parvulin-like peptidyl-prolyl isomerase
MPRTVRLVVASVAASLLLAACGDAATQPGSTAATVGSTTITDEQLAHQAKLYTFLSGLQQQPCGGQPAQGQSQEATCNRFALTNAIQERLVLDYAEANDVTVTDKEVTDIVGNLDTQLGKDVVDKALREQGLTRDDLNSLARSVLLFQDVQQQVVASEIGDEDLHAMYEDHIAEYTTVQVEHILVDTKAEADDVYRQVTAPGATEKTFQDLAKRVSTDSGSAKNGGSLGSAVASTYLPEFARAVAALKPGEISRPVQTQVGWHVIRLVTKQVTPFEQAKPQLVQGQATDVFNAWMRRRLDEGGLEINPKYGRFDEQQLAVVPVSSTDPSGTSAPSASASGSASAASPTP